MPNFNLRGKSRISSIVGSILSALVFLIVIFYGANRLSLLIERRNPTISSFVQRDAVTKYDELNLRDAGLRFAFGVENFLDQKLRNDPAYVKWILRAV